VPSQPPLTTRGTLLRLAGCLAISGVVWLQVAGTEWEEYRWLFWTEVTLGLAAYVLAYFRRRAPVPVAVVVATLSTFSGVAAGPATLTAVSVATRRQMVPIIVVTAVNFVAATTYTFLAPFVLQYPPFVSVLINLAVNVGMMGWGMYIGSRRELLWTLNQRALRAETEQALRVAQARSGERSRIAREMHDVLAHRITQVSMTAGALAFREDLDADELRRHLGSVQDRANRALHELRGVLGVLRDSDTGQPLDAPQPTYGDIERLVADARRDGSNVRFSSAVADTGALPDAVGRAIYRIVQEGLTNAHKHAPGALLDVELSGGPSDGISLALRNPLGFGPSSAPGAGLGLVGLTERAELRGGRLEHRVEDQHFVVEAWVPWST
jgi:signal transduction histidine kinase